ncbi:MAG: helix-turn-helix transcriptional regulator [Verrucomicrobiota bacterium]
MSESIGKQLKQARLKRGLSVEDISHETRIQESMLRNLEEDDYSHFPSPTYARSFLSIYSESLDVDASEIIDAMSGPQGGGIGASKESLEPIIDLTPSEQTIPIFKDVEEPQKGHPVLMILLFVGLIVLVPSVFLIGKRIAHEEFAQQAALAAANSDADTSGETGSSDSTDDSSTVAPGEPQPNSPRSEADLLNDLIWTPTSGGTEGARITPSTPPPTGAGGGLIAPVAKPIPIPQPEDPPAENVPSSSEETQ